MRLLMMWMMYSI